VRRDLERIEIPGEHEARERTWQLVSAAYAEREPREPRRASVRPLLVAAAIAALAAAAFSPPGRAVIDSVRRAVGVESADEGLFRLPGGGRLLVTSSSGAWVVSADGSKRRLGDYEAASWSPFGRYVAASRVNELAALEPDGETRWKLSRPGVRFPAWTGSRTDTRIAYVTDSRLHVVGGDGQRDVDAGGLTAPARVQPVWRPGLRFELSYLDTSRRVQTFPTDGPGTQWRSQRLPDARRLVWSPRGERLAVVGRNRIVFIDGASGRPRAERMPGVADVAYSADGRLATVRRAGGTSALFVDGKLRFSGTGTFTGLAWSPDRRWVLLGWVEPDQWLFVSASGPRRVRAFANVARQFDSSTPPRIEGWCCR
jgi:hypothetical protein